MKELMGGKKLKSSVLVLGILLGTIWMSSCKHDIPQPVIVNNGGGNGGGGGGGGGGNTGIPCDSDSVYFNLQILPILVSNCGSSGCHDPASHEDGVVLTSYQAVMNSGVIEPGDPNDGDLMEAILETNPDDRMPPPPASPLTSQQIQLIQTWIAQGAQNLNCDGICDTSNVTFAAVIRPIMQNKCQGCHQGTSPGGGVNLSNYAGISGAAFDGSLLGSVEHAAGWSAMPKNAAALPDCDIAKIRIWVNAGAPNN
ncbi:MAG: hypothetical protein JNL88_04140 [Bacteroidia bacterium]|nr:hypothetical protein [Bacteroidia bacterium]